VYSTPASSTRGIAIAQTFGNGWMENDDGFYRFGNAHVQRVLVYVRIDLGSWQGRQLIKRLLTEIIVT
jgi:hypothetical protein